MKTTAAIVAAVLLLVCCNAASSRACTTLTIKDNRDNIFFARNFDFFVGDAHVTVNKRGLKKTALIKPPEKRMTWTSRLGSVTFNLIGREFPIGGMNEAGLVVEILKLERTEYPEMDERYGLTLLQWVQYQLDNSRTVEDVIKSDALVRVSRQSTIVNHFMISDRNGSTAVIEYLDGKMKYYNGGNMKLPVLTNSPYESSLNYLNTFADFGGKNPLPGKDESSEGRFAIAASLAQKYKGEGNAIDYCFKVLDRVSQVENEWSTQWSIVYDINNMKIHYRTAKNKDVRTVALKDFDFGCATKSQIVDVDKAVTGKSDFSDYSVKAHRDLVERVFNALPAFKNIPPERRDAFVRYPETIACVKADNSE